jgi:hypothetical protein
MPQTCTICNHQDRDAIERALLSGDPYRHIAARTGTSTGSLQRHKDHLPKQLAKTHEAQELVRAGSLMASVQTAHDRSERLYCAAEDILTRAQDAKDLRTALQAIRCAVDVMGEARNYLELQGQITGELRNDGDDGSPKVILTIAMPSGPMPPPIGLDRRLDHAPHATVDVTLQSEQLAPGAVVIDVRR